MIRLKSKGRLKLNDLCRLTVTLQGTRRYGDDITEVLRAGERLRVDPSDILETDKVVYRGQELLRSGIIVARRVFRNIVCVEGKELVGGFMIDASAVYDVGLTYQEIGTGTTTPAASDTTLTIYAARKAITARSRSANIVTFSTFWTAAQCTYNIKEAAVWGGSNAAAGEATGLIFAHWLSSYDNSVGNYDLTYDYVLTIG